MLRISRLTDYCSASDVAAETHVALPTVQKLLKVMARSGLVDSVRGADGGYQLTRAPESISAAEILDILEGPVAITECSTEASRCELESLCQVGSAWQRINTAIRGALEDISLADLGHPPREFPPLRLRNPRRRTETRIHFQSR